MTSSMWGQSSHVNINNNYNNKENNNNTFSYHTDHRVTLNDGIV